MGNSEQRFTLRHICFADALRYADEDVALLQQLAELFLREGPKQVDAVDEALRNQDFARAAREAHTLKGSVAVLAAHEIQDRLRRFEGMLSEGMPSEGMPSEGMPSEGMPSEAAEADQETPELAKDWKQLQQDVSELRDEANQLAKGLAS